MGVGNWGYRIGNRELVIQLKQNNAFVNQINTVPHKGGSCYKSKDFCDIGVPVLKIKNVQLRYINTSEINFVHRQIAAKTQNYYINSGDILISMTGSGIHAPDSMVGRVARYTGKSNRFLINQRVGRFIIHKPEKLNSRYLFFVLTQPEYQWELVSIATGSANQVNISAKQIQTLEIPLPPLSEQKAIAHILGTLDDKIELNQRMNRTLEAIAQAIFKSWFINFDPVRAKVEGRQPVGMSKEVAALFPDSFVDSDLGMIPKGWEVKPLSEVMDINPKRFLSKGQKAPYLDMKNMPKEGHRPDYWIERELNSGIKFINGDTLMARITPCLENGKIAFVDFLNDKQVGWGSTEYIVFRPKYPFPLEFGYYLARSDDLKIFAVQNMTGSSGRQRVQIDCFKQYLLPICSKEIAIKFGDIVQSLMKNISSNSNQSRKLANIRDTLLPKLISGEIRVKEAEKIVEEVV